MDAIPGAGQTAGCQDGWFTVVSMAFFYVRRRQSSQAAIRKKTVPADRKLM